MATRTRDHWISTSRPISGSYAELTFGGISLYSSTPEALDKYIDQVRTATSDVLLDHLLLIRQVLKAKVQENCSFSLTDRIFGAVLGRMLKMGELKVLLCLTANFKRMRVIYHSKNHDRLNEIIAAVRAKVLIAGSVSTSEVQASYFEGLWAGYYMAQQVCGALSYRGYLVHTDRDQFVLPREVIDAVGLRIS